MSDDRDTLADLKLIVAKFVDERDWGSLHTPKNLAMSIAIEAAEIMELFQWTKPDLEASDIVKADTKFKRELSFELADVMIYCLSLAFRTGIDLADAIREKTEINRTRFPINNASFRLKKHSQ